MKMSLHSAFRVVFLFLLGVVVGSAPLLAQSGSGAISGVVTGPDGVTPLAGVSVYASPFSGGPEVGGFAMTLSDGSYAITGLSSGSYRVQFSPPSGSSYAWEYFNNTQDYFSAMTVVVVSGATTPSINASLELGGTISGVVTGSDGVTPLAGVNVSASGSGDFGYATTLPDGSYEITGLRAGSYQVYFIPPFGSSYSGEYYNSTTDYLAATQVLVVAGETRSGVNASLESNASGTITGVVTGPNGSPVANVEVSAFPITAGGMPGSAITGPDGTYEINGLAIGNYSVKFSAGQGSTYAAEYYDNARDSWSWTLVEVNSGQTTSGINASLEFGGTISGRVTGPDGLTPLAGVQVWATPGAASPATTEADGTYEITGLYAGEYTVEFSPPAGTPYVGELYSNAFEWSAAATVSVVPGGTASGIDASLELGGSISGLVTGPDGVTPLEGAYVQLMSPAGGYYGSVPTQPDGSYEITQVRAGAYRVLFIPSWTSGYAFEFYNDVVDPAVSTLVSITAGGIVNDIDASLGIGAAVSGMVTDSIGQPLSDANVVPLRWTGSEWVELPIGGWAWWDGSYTINLLPAGDYVFRFELPGYEVRFYGGVSDISGATEVSLGAGDSLSGLDIALPEEIPWVEVASLARLAPGAFRIGFVGRPTSFFQFQKSGTLQSWTNVGPPVRAVPDYRDHDGWVGTNSIPISTTANKEFWRLIEAEPSPSPTPPPYPPPL
jgi:hypothetical protein